MYTLVHLDWYGGYLIGCECDGGWFYYAANKDERGLRKGVWLYVL